MFLHCLEGLGFILVSSTLYSSHKLMSLIVLGKAYFKLLYFTFSITWKTFYELKYRVCNMVVVFRLYRVRRNFHSNILPITQLLLYYHHQGPLGAFFNQANTTLPMERFRFPKWFPKWIIPFPFENASQRFAAHSITLLLVSFDSKLVNYQSPTESVKINKSSNFSVTFASKV